MKNQTQNDNFTRKSNRQRVPNSFYTEAINQLKKTPKNIKESINKPNNKKSKLYEDNQSNSFNDQILQNYKNYDSKQHRNQYLCKLPKSGSFIKIQFILNHPQQYVPQKRKEETNQMVVSAKGNESSFDLLSLFKKAIQNVNNQDENDKQMELQQPVKEIKIKKEVSLMKNRKMDENQGNISSVEWKDGNLILAHSIMGERQFKTEPIQLAREESSNNRQVNYFKQKLMNSAYLKQISILN